MRKVVYWIISTELAAIVLILPVPPTGLVISSFEDQVSQGRLSTSVGDALKLGFFAFVTRINGFMCIKAIDNGYK